MKKRILSTLLALCMVLALLPGTAWAAEITSGKCGPNLNWTYDSGVLTISGTGRMNGSSWWGLSADHKNSLTSVVIQQGATNIVGQAFCRYFPNIKNVIIPNSVTEIGISAFSGCTKLTRPCLKNAIRSSK